MLNPISSETTNNAVASNIQETEILEEGEERNGDDERTNARFDYEGYDYHQPPQFQPYPYDYHHPYPYHQPEQPPYPSNSDRYGPTERYPPNETQYSAYGYPQNRPPYSPYPTYPPSYNYPNQPYHHQAQITEIDPNEVPISLAKIKTSSPTFAKVVVENEAESPFHLDQEESTEMEIDNSNNAAVQIEQESGEVMAVDGDESLQEMEGESTEMMSGVDSNQ